MIAGALPGVVVLLWLNHALYGSVVGSGYGDADALFSVAHIDDNLSELLRAPSFRRRTSCLLVGCWRRSSSRTTRRQCRSCCWLRAVVIAIYLLYQPYPEWWYLRFLIPALVAAA